MLANEEDTKKSYVTGDIIGDVIGEKDMTQVTQERRKRKKPKYSPNKLHGFKLMPWYGGWRRCF